MQRALVIPPWLGCGKVWVPPPDKTAWINPLLPTAELCVSEVPSFSIHAGTGMTLTHWCNAVSSLYYSTCMVIYIFHICTRDHTYSDRLQT